MAQKSATDIDREFGRRVRAVRLAKGISQERLAEALGITFQQVQKYEKGTNRISVSRAVAIAAALGVGLMDLFEQPTAAAPALEEGRNTAARRAASLLQDARRINDELQRLVDGRAINLIAAE